MAYRTHFVDDVFDNKKREIKQLIADYNLPPVKSEADAWRKLNFLLGKYPDEILTYLAQIHPDKDIILKANAQSVSDYSNCCGADGFSSCEGNPNCNCHLKKNKKEKTSSCTGCDMMKMSGVDSPASTNTKSDNKNAENNNQNHHVLAITAIVVTLGIIVVAAKS